MGKGLWISSGQSQTFNRPELGMASILPLQPNDAKEEIKSNLERDTER